MLTHSVPIIEAIISSPPAVAIRRHRATLRNTLIRSADQKALVKAEVQMQVQVRCSGGVETRDSRGERGLLGLTLEVQQ